MKSKESETVRSFLAIEVDNDLIPQITDVQKEFKKTNTRIKYVPQENMHLTSSLYLV